MNIDGNTARLAKEVFRGLEYTPINLAEFHINQIGQESGGQPNDFQKVMKQTKEELDSLYKALSKIDIDETHF